MHRKRLMIEDRWSIVERLGAEEHPLGGAARLQRLLGLLLTKRFHHGAQF
jgi:hypothetical protein